MSIMFSLKEPSCPILCIENYIVYICEVMRRRGEGRKRGGEQGEGEQRGEESREKGNRKDRIGEEKDTDGLLALCPASPQEKRQVRTSLTFGRADSGIEVRHRASSVRVLILSRAVAATREGKKTFPAQWEEESEKVKCRASYRGHQNWKCFRMHRHYPLCQIQAGCAESRATLNACVSCIQNACSRILYCMYDYIHTELNDIRPRIFTS